MSAKYIPGPWTCGDNATGDFWVIRSKPQPRYEPIVLLPIAEEATARLIAAAPDLLEALSAALDEYKASDCGCDGEYLDGDTVGHACYFHRVERQIKRAIAKASGK